ncbi:MAG TPA: hypothetical protein VHY19_00885 [Steroidobacteraceae bacterium]|nr:hypothetical protein [Steroidobacteraceae bacterium]
MSSNQSRVRAVRPAVRGMIERGTSFAIVFAVALAALPQVVVAQGPAQAQAANLSGAWVSPPTNDVLERLEGPFTDDWTGMPLNEAGRSLAQSYSAAMLGEPERVCQLYGQFHYANGAVGTRLTIWPVEGGPIDQILAWKINKTEDVAGMTIWMDGRSQPSKYLDHPREAFTTGHWMGNKLIAYSTDMKRAPARDNGAFYSDQATLTTTFIPHQGDLLVIVSALRDPVYMTKPYIYSRAYNRADVSTAVNTTWPPCIVNNEGVDEGDVSFFLPGKDPLRDQMMQVFHVPESASDGGEDTMYPEFRNKIKAQYLKLYPTFPKHCKLYCTTFRNGNPVANQALPEEPVPPLSSTQSGP